MTIYEREVSLWGLIKSKPKKLDDLKVIDLEVDIGKVRKMGVVDQDSVEIYVMYQGLGILAKSFPDRFFKYQINEANINTKPTWYGSYKIYQWRE